jgi:hypothetical protein
MALMLVTARLLFTMPTIHGDHGAFFMAGLFLIVGAGSLGLWLLSWMLTGGTDISIDPNYGKPKE